MSFTKELVLFVTLCAVLRLGGAALDFIARWASAIRRDVPEPLGQDPPLGDEAGGRQGVSRLEVHHSHSH